MVAEKVPIAALAAGVRSSIGESGLDGGSGGNGKSSPGVNPGGLGLGEGAGVGPPPGGVGEGAGVGPPPGGVGEDAGVGVGFKSIWGGSITSAGLVSSPRTRYQLFVTGVILEPSPWTTKYLKVPPSASPLKPAPPSTVLTTSSALFTGRSDP
jgi:hypothetical protein